MPPQNPGMLIVGIGLIVVLIGSLIWFGWFSWFGQLPGDLRVEKPSVKFYFPFTSMLVISIVINVLLYLIRKIF